MKNFSFAYGETTKEFSLDEKKILKVITMPNKEPIKDIKQAVLDAIRHPIGCEPLSERVKPNDTVTFICNDPTRVANSFDFMPVLVNEMNALGVPDENMQIIFSLGTHRKMTEEEMREGVGEEVASRIKMCQSDCNRPEDFDYFGTTSRFTPVLINKKICSCSHVILTGTIVHHFFSGYGGGRKAVFPGCAAMESIRHNHSFMVDKHAGLGKTVGNPVYEDQLEAVALWAKNRSVFLFNAVLDEKHRFLKMFAGDYVKAHQVACQFVDEVYGVPIEKQADVVIASCGGYPKDINVYQMQKTMDNAVLAVREGGVVIVVAECREGSGSQPLEDTFHRLKTHEAIENNLRQKFVIGAHKAFAITRLMQRAKFILVTKLDPQLAKDMLFTATTDSVEDALNLAKKYVGEDYSVILMPTGSLTVPLFKK